MLTEERKSKIIAIITQYGYIRNDKLAQKLYTSTSTVRRNLNELEKLGLVKRSHGGVQLASLELDLPFILRSKKNTNAKKIIAQKASSHLKDNSVIFIDASSTCLNLVPYILDHKNITVFTNGIEISSLLSDSDIDVYMLGGKVKHNSLATVGENALKMVDTLYFDAMFFSSSGYTDKTVSDYSYSETLLRQKIMTNAKEKYFLCDSSKNGKKFNFIVCKDSELTEVITD